MSKFSKVLFAAVAASVGITAAANAATVTYTLVLNDNNGTNTFGANKWSLYADVSTGDNAGLAGFGVALTNYSSASGKLAVGAYQMSSGQTDANGDPIPSQPTGWDTAAKFSTTAPISAALNTTGAEWVLTGFGQTALNISTKDLPGWPFFSDPNSTPPGNKIFYDGYNNTSLVGNPAKAHLLLATGAYTGTVATASGGAAGDGTFIMTPADYATFTNATNFDKTVNGINNTKANVLVQGTVDGYNVSTITGVIVTQTRNLQAAATNIPEPASIGVLALGGLAMLARRRKA